MSATETSREPSIRESDIESKVCQLCASCCRIRLKITNTDSRYRKFLRAVGFRVLPEPKLNELDCCDSSHDIDIDMGYCKHLQAHVEGNLTRYECSIYETDMFPDLCRHFNCVAWAKAHNNYNTNNSLLMTAEKALMAAKRAGDVPGGHS